MRVVPQRVTDIWMSGVFTGEDRPIARVTTQRTDIRAKTYLSQRFTTYLFGNRNEIKELPNVRSVKWSRATETDVATCEIKLYNTEPLPIGEAPPNDDYIYNQPGYFTFNRGDEANRWSHDPNEWTHRLFPDMMIRTYEGYGVDTAQPPEIDEHMMPSGVWFIDQVDLNDEPGMLTLKCVDAGSLLTEEICFPPVVPSGHYPLRFGHYQLVDDDKVPAASGGGGQWVNIPYHDDSSRPYGGPNMNIGGHRASDAFDGSNTSYWLSIGNASPTSDYAFEWIEGKFKTPKTVGAVRVFAKGGPYRVYISLHTTDKGWVGHSNIPYNPSDPISAPNGSNIRFLKSASVAANKDVTIDVRDTPNVDRVRFTFHDLWDSNYGTYQYRAAVRDVDVYTLNSTSTTWVIPGQHYVGNYSDYTDIVKWLLAYGGFLFPIDNALDFTAIADTDTATNQTKVMKPPTRAWTWMGGITVGPGDPVLWGLNPTDYQQQVLDKHLTEIGQIWGDIEQSGTFGPADLTVDIFDKKPLMDGISYVRDILGFVFFVDEIGGAIFRSPNIWRKGNWVLPKDYRLATTPTAHYDTTAFVTIDERQTLNAMHATLNRSNRRERVVIANVGGGIGAVSAGFQPYGIPSGGHRRVGIWSDQHFTTLKECQTMADLIAVRQLFTFRTDTIRVPGYPAIQIDDQVKIVEETTEENADLHYVKGITSSLDMSTGEWWYDIDTHWLGTEPFSDWVFDPANLAPDTQEYLIALGVIT